MLVIVNKVDRGKLERGESAAGRKISPSSRIRSGTSPVSYFAAAERASADVSKRGEHKSPRNAYWSRVAGGVLTAAAAAALGVNAGSAASRISHAVSRGHD